MGASHISTKGRGGIYIPATATTGEAFFTLHDHGPNGFMAGLVCGSSLLPLLGKGATPRQATLSLATIPEASPYSPLLLAACTEP